MTERILPIVVRVVSFFIVQPLLAVEVVTDRFVDNDAALDVVPDSAVDDAVEISNEVSERL